VSATRCWSSKTRERLYSEAVARDVYRVALKTERGRITVDEAETRKLRAR
jgi:hypothetical protein